MSIRVMTNLWRNSPHKGSALLLLLAIADFADDAGVAYPAVATLAKKIRMSVRQTRNLIQKLKKEGALYIQFNAGPKGCNLYRVQSLQGDACSREGGQPVADTPAVAIAAEPSGSITEPSLDNYIAHRDAKLSTAVSGAPSSDFARFWQQYPKKAAKVNAERAWHALLPDADLQAKMLAALEAHMCSEQWTQANGKFVPHAASWIRQRRWEDELLANRQQSPKINLGGLHDGIGTDGRF